MKPRKLLEAAAMSALAVGCGGADVVRQAVAEVGAVPAMAPIEQRIEELARVEREAALAAAPMPPECGCAAGNSKAPRYEGAETTLATIESAR